MELEVCELYGIRHSEFLAWDADDRDKALWRRIRARQTCPSCSTRREEWDEKLGGHRYAYIPEVQQCRGCEVKQSAEASITSDDGRGVYVALKRRQEVTGGDENP